MSTPSNAKLLERCLKIVMNPSANEADKRLAIDCAYDLGVTTGHLEGVQEAGKRLLASFDAKVAKVAS